VLEAILEGILLRQPKDRDASQQLVFFEELVKPKNCPSGWLRSKMSIPAVAEGLFGTPGLR
jgi:hypothetical protein